MKLAVLRLILGFACVWPTGTRAAGVVDFVVDPSALSFARELDGLGNGSTFVVDTWATTFNVPVQAVQADTYRFRFALPQPVEIEPDVMRVDVLVALGTIESTFGIIPPDYGAAAVAWVVDNVAVTSTSEFTVQFRDAGFGPVTGVGVEARQWLGGVIVAPGEPLLVHFLDVTFTVPEGMLERDVPGSPVNSVELVLGAGGIVATADLPGLAPMLRAVPEPGGMMVMVAAVCSGLLGRRGRVGRGDRRARGSSEDCCRVTSRGGARLHPWRRRKRSETARSVPEAKARLLVFPALLGLVLSAAAGSPAHGESVLVSDFASVNPRNRVLQFSARTGAFERVVVDSFAGLDSPGAMALHPTRQTLLVSNFNTNSVMEFDLETGGKLAEFGSGELLHPVGLAVHPTRGTLLVSGRDNPGILEYGLDDFSYRGVFATAPAIDSAFGFDFDIKNGGLFLANYQPAGGSLVKFNLSTGALIEAWGGRVIAPTDVLIHPLTGNVLMDSNHEILEFNPVSGALIRTFADDPGLDFPSDLAWSYETNDLLVISRGRSQSVFRFDGITGESEGVLIPSGTAGLTGPSRMLMIPEPSTLSLLVVGAFGRLARSNSSLRAVGPRRNCGV